MDVLIVNINTLEYTSNLVNDLKNQIFKDFKLTLVDQASREPGTEEYLQELEQLDWVTAVRNSENRPLNHVWNDFVRNSDSPYVCLLNSDIRVPRNFMRDNYEILKNNPDIGAVMHPTNHPDYSKTDKEIKFDILPTNRVKQGWDICIKKDGFVPIAPQLHLFYGDDWIFEHLYGWGFEAAMATSSPIIHYQGVSQNDGYNKHINKDWSVDERHFHQMGYTKYLGQPAHYTVLRFQDSPLEEIEDVWA
jgi:glycosyltransferase involved in cell wall biosynthesis